MNGAVAKLACMIEEASGFVIPPRGHGPLASIAREQIALLKLASIEEYVDLLSRRSDSREWRQLLGRITVKESYMYRGRAQFEALTGTVLDEIAALDAQFFRVWCAGCARGEEAVTLAIELASHPVVSALDWSILATDVDDDALDEAREGRYGERAVARVPTDILKSRFTHSGNRYEVDRRILDRIEYRRVNLVDLPSELEETPFDVIFLRNVLIYFRPELQRRVIEKVEQVLAPHGVLFLGPSESLLPLEASLRPRNLGNCFCYRWPLPIGEQQAGDSNAPASREKVHGCSVPSPVRPLPPTPGAGLAPVKDWMRRTVDAVAAGDLERARGLASELRNEFPENSIAHVLVGWTAIRAGDMRAAVLAYRAALYLDPGTLEIRYLLAEALEADGRSDRALREYRSVLTSTGMPETTTIPVFVALGVPGRTQITSICRKKVENK